MLKLGFLGISLIAVSVLMYVQDRQADFVPPVELSPPMIVRDHLTLDSAVRVEFEVINHLSSEVRIANLVTDCSCTTPEFSRGAIAPGESTTVSVVIQPPSQPSSIIVQIHVICAAMDGGLIRQSFSFHGRYTAEAALPSEADPNGFSDETHTH